MLWNNSIHPDDLPHVNQTIREVATSKPFCIEYRIRDAQGNWHWFEDRSTGYSNDGADVVMEGFVLDITERKQAEEALNHSRWRLKSIIEGTHVGTWEWNVQTGDTVFNDTWAEIIGYTLDALSPTSIKTWETLSHPDDLKQSGELLARHFAGELPYYDYECRMKHKDGHWVWVHDRGRIISRTRDGKPLMMFGTHTDITERKHAEVEKAELEAQNRQLQKAESLGRMAGAIAHHFNNQLYVVIGNLELVMNDLPLGSDESERLIDAMKASHRAADVSKLMLTYLGQAPGKLELQDLSETCHKGLLMLQAIIPKNVLIEPLFPFPGPTIRANMSQMHQIFTNLVTNAWESISEKKGTITLSIKTVSSADISLSHRFPINWRPKEKLYACLEVADTCCGIADQSIEKIFDPFFTTKFTGRGLGLSVVLGIVKAHDGGITVESEPGRGSVFRIFLPVSTEELPGRPDIPTLPGSLQTGKPEKLSEIAEGGTVLLIEDEEPVRNMARIMLIRMGYTVLEAEDGVEALEIFQQHQDEIQCVLSDLTMPRMDGWDTLTALRKLSPDIPVILTSGYDEAQVMANEHPDRPNAFLGKPYHLKELRETITRVLSASVHV
jgi:PAS domain S-box-containing protein